MEFIFVFSTGRSGTALLAQYFGGVFKNKYTWNYRDNIAIAHEPFDELEEYSQAIKDIKQGKDPKVAGFLLRELEKNKKCDKYLITDNKLGRWFWDDFCREGIKIRMIYLLRNERDVVRSLQHTFPNGIFWGYQPTDANSLVDRTLPPPWYHVKETSAQWIKIREKLASDQYIEISFERFLKEKAERERLQNFVRISGYDNLLKHRINTHIPFFGMAGYGDKRKSMKKMVLEVIGSIFKRVLISGRFQDIGKS